MARTHKNLHRQCCINSTECWEQGSMFASKEDEVTCMFITQIASSITYIGVTLNALYNFIMAGMAVALVYWYRDCDPLLSGAITKLDQMLPYYVKENLGDFPGFSGLFLTGVVSAATSTVSSIINSQAAVFYVDVISQYRKFSSQQAAAFTKKSALFFGCVLTACAVAVPHLGSAVRLILVLHSGGTAPFVGLFVLGLIFPWANAKGAAVGTLVAGSLQLWLMFGKIALDVHSPGWASLSTIVQSTPLFQ
ncbi:sodium-coupled monocarboxylate transporter 2-like [Rhipicephalus sanguineus]|uniref:sodium-coupled monocarboxylate transporter 2-like n=1 Tax=Rhipicephalus sanguineus TaxID=34632 RepID=UPI0020C4C8F3|nr:sodium-coupled monocarboxylate transporter 2-like [Rhipicephalus sanguineus]